MKRTRKGLRIILFAMLLIVTTGLITVHAESKKNQAKKAYKEFVEANVVQRNTRGAITNSTTCITRFALIYLNNDSVPELLVEHGGLLYSPYVYTYKNGKIEEIEGPMIAASAYVKGYYKKKGCLVLEDEGNGYPYHLFRSIYCVYKTGKLIPRLEKDYTGTEKKIVSGLTYYYNSKNNVQQDLTKKISKAKFNKNLKKIVGSKKLTKIKMQENTEVNRNKIF